MHSIVVDYDITELRISLTYHNKYIIINILS